MQYDTDSFTVYIKTDDFYKDIAQNVEKRFDTSNYKLDRPLPKRKRKKIIGLRKDELDEKIMKDFLGLRAKPYSYLINDGNENKKGTKKFVIKLKLRFEDYKDYLKATYPENKINDLEKNEIDVDSLKIDHNELLKNNKLILKTQKIFKIESLNVCTEEIY